MTSGVAGYTILTYGCQMNEHDSERMSGLLEMMGYCRASSLESSDIVLLNTCCVRENAENKVYGKVGDLKHLKDQNPDLIIGICGCMPQEKVEVERIKKSYPQVDLVFGTHNIHQLPELIDRIRTTRSRVIEVWDSEGEIQEELPVRREGNLKAWVSITFGCNNFCTYCIVPYTRGRERSRKPEAIIKEVRQLGKERFKEITLLGQNVNSYGRDLGDGTNFAKLLLMLDEDDSDILRIRYTTSHPRDFTDELIETIAKSDRVMNNFHLPLQAGSDRILKRMNRGYTTEQYLRLVEKVRNAVPDCSITTDLIVGFPGETDSDYENTLNMVRTVNYDSAYMFAYSPRVGTPAAEYEDQVDEDLKKDRLYKLIELQNTISRRINETLKGRTFEVLVEGESETNSDTLAGRTRSNKLCIFPKTKEGLTGRLVSVKVEEPKTWTLHGVMV